MKKEAINAFKVLAKFKELMVEYATNSYSSKFANCQANVEALFSGLDVA